VAVSWVAKPGWCSFARTASVGGELLAHADPLFILMGEVLFHTGSR